MRQLRYVMHLINVINKHKNMTITDNNLLNNMNELLEQKGFIKIDGLEKWFINFQGRTYYVFKDSGKWWVVINKEGIDIKINQTGFTTFNQIKDLFNAITLYKLLF